MKSRYCVSGFQLRRVVSGMGDRCPPLVFFFSFLVESFLIGFVMESMETAEWGGGGGEFPAPISLLMISS